MSDNFWNSDVPGNLQSRLENTRKISEILRNAFSTKVVFVLSDFTEGSGTGRQHAIVGAVKAAGFLPITIDISNMDADQINQEITKTRKRLSTAPGSYGVIGHGNAGFSAFYHAAQNTENVDFTLAVAPVFDQSEESLHASIRQLHVATIPASVIVGEIPLMTTGRRLYELQEIKPALQIRHIADTNHAFAGKEDELARNVQLAIEVDSDFSKAFHRREQKPGL